MRHAPARRRPGSVRGRCGPRLRLLVTERRSGPVETRDAVGDFSPAFNSVISTSSLIRIARATAPPRDRPGIGRHPSRPPGSAVLGFRPSPAPDPHRAGTSSRRSGSRTPHLPPPRLPIGPDTSQPAGGFVVGAKMPAGAASPDFRRVFAPHSGRGRPIGVIRRHGPQRRQYPGVSRVLGGKFRRFSPADWRFLGPGVQFHLARQGNCSLLLRL